VADLRLKEIPVGRPTSAHNQERWWISNADFFMKVMLMNIGFANKLAS
jgi:hypothetical protein